MLRFLPILLLLLQTLPMALPLQAANECAQAPQKMSCCGGSCQCAADGCECGQKRDDVPAPSKTPFSMSSVDFAPTLASATYSLPSKVATGEIKRTATTKRTACTNNRKQALLGRWQN